MSLDKHFINHVLGRYLCRPPGSSAETRPNYAVEVIQVLKSVRKLHFSEILSKDKYVEQIERELEATKAKWQSKLDHLATQQEQDSGYGDEDFDSDEYGSSSEGDPADDDG